MPKAEFTIHKLTDGGTVCYLATDQAEWGPIYCKQCARLLLQRVAGKEVTYEQAALIRNAIITSTLQDICKEVKVVLAGRIYVIKGARGLTYPEVLDLLVSHELLDDDDL